jgi:2'-5' RNA ligase
MPRLFTGIELPPEISQQIASLGGGLPGARWLEPDDLHLTLSFIGDVDGNLSDAVIEELANVQSDPFEIVLDGLGAFGGDRPRALVFNANADVRLINVHKQQERALRRAGIALEKRKFTPHVTLARLRAVSPQALAHYVSMNPPPVLRFRTERFMLYSARPKVGGGPYVVEAAYPFVNDDYGSSTESQ